jgi:DNA topoisomerase-6 subunit A
MARPKTVPVQEKIVETAQDVHSKILKNKSPTMVTPVRSLSNVKYQLKTGYFEMLGKNKQRTLTVSTVKTFAQTLKMMSLAKELIDSNDMAPKREAYYISKNRRNPTLSWTMSRPCSVSTASS